eukprot:COSAG01_NODE_1662_length_9555_cov_32.392718_9_plen_130_part_00
MRAQADYLVERYAYHLRVIGIPTGMANPDLTGDSLHLRELLCCSITRWWLRYMKKHPADDAALAEVHSLSSGLKPVVTWATAAVRGHIDSQSQLVAIRPTGTPNRRAMAMSPRAAELWVRACAGAGCLP